MECSLERGNFSHSALLQKEPRLQRANNSFKPTPRRGVVVSSWQSAVPASAASTQRRGLTQALGANETVSLLCAWGELPA